MSSYNSFAALASPAPPFRENTLFLGSKRPHFSSSSPLTASQQSVMVDTSALDAIDKYLVFDILNIFHYHWFIACEHLTANVLSATRDDNGCFIWVDFLPQFHTLLIKCMCTLLLTSYSVSKGKKVLFVFLLEILTGDGPIKLESFWHAPKKHS
jgi:hypothetical protein